MQIKSLYIREFGGLRDTALSLSDGLNLILGNNESGKSTVVAFIRFIFYGLPKRIAGESLSDGDRAFSWQNGVADGSMTLASNETTYRIERRETEGSARKFLQIVNESTGEVLPKGSTPESVFLHVPLSVFDSTACIRQLRSGDLDGTDLSAAIENMILSGNESVSVDRALSALDKARKVLLHKNGKGGEIYNLQKQLNELNQALTDIHRHENELHLARETCARLEQTIRELEAEKSRLESELKRMQDVKILRRFDALRREKAELEAEETRLAPLRDRYHDPNAPTVSVLQSLEAAASEIESDAREELRLEADLRVAKAADHGDPSLIEAADRVRQNGGVDAISETLRTAASAEKRTHLLPIVGIALAAAVFVLSIIIVLITHSPFGALTALLAVPCIAFALLSRKKAKIAAENFSALRALYQIPPTEQDPVHAFVTFAERAFREVERTRICREALDTASAALECAKEKHASRISAIRDQFSDVLHTSEPITPTSLRSIAAILRTRYNEFLRAEDALTERKRNFAVQERTLAEYNEASLRAEAEAAPLPSADTEEAKKLRLATVRVDLERTKSEHLDASRSHAALEATITPTDTIEHEIAEQAATLRALEQKHQAILRATSALTEAREHLQNSVSPRLRQGAGEMLYELTHEAYDCLAVENDFSLSLTSKDSGQVHPIEAFSGGTRDIVYTALRLALCDLLVSNRQDALPPLILDETLAQLDDNRAKALLHLLLHRAEAKNAQILLFTCHTREKALLRDENVNVITLSE